MRRALLKIARLLPQIYQGEELKSKDVENMLSTVGWVNKVSQRDSTDYEDIK